jgi:hemoglobin-like flavoprotein
MTLRQIELVQQSFRLIQPIIDDAAILFYERLFEIDPSLRPMFNRPRREQARMLSQTLTVVVKGISVMPTTAYATPTMRRWGRHSCGRSRWG